LHETYYLDKVLKLLQTEVNRVNIFWAQQCGCGISRNSPTSSNNPFMHFYV